MKLSAILGFAAFFIKTCVADFYIYETGGFTDQVPAIYYAFFHTHPSCSDVRNKGDAYIESNDVSKRKGVVCEGRGCSNGNPNDITRLEMHTTWGHYTIYKNRDFKLYDTRDRVVGTCRPDRSKSWLCANSGLTNGASLFWCTTSVGNFP